MSSALPTITLENVNQLLEKYATVSWQANSGSNIKDGATLLKWFKFLNKTDDEQVMDGDVVLTKKIVYTSVFSFLEKSPKSCFNLVDASFLNDIRAFIVTNFFTEEEQTEKIVEL